MLLFASPNHSPSSVTCAAPLLKSMGPVMAFAPCFSFTSGRLYVGFSSTLANETPWATPSVQLAAPSRRSLASFTPHVNASGVGSFSHATPLGESVKNFLPSLEAVFCEPAPSPKSNSATNAVAPEILRIFIESLICAPLRTSRHTLNASTAPMKERLPSPRLPITSPCVFSCAPLPCSSVTSTPFR